MVRQLILIDSKNRIDLMVRDVGIHAAPSIEKNWTIIGSEFDKQAYSIVEITRTLYGWYISSQAFCKFVVDCLRRMSLKPTQDGYDIWFWKSEDHYIFDIVNRVADERASGIRIYVIGNIDDIPHAIPNKNINNNILNSKHYVWHSQYYIIYIYILWYVR